MSDIEYSVITSDVIKSFDCIYFEGSQVAIFILNYPLLRTGSTQEDSKSSQGFSLQVLVVGGLKSWFVKLSQCMRFPTTWYVRPAKPQISLRIRAV